MADKSFNRDESDESSDDNLKIVIESPTRKRKPTPVPTESERQIIESIEDELERKLEEKAAKTNLNAVHVRNIIRQVVKNEHVLTLIRNAENAKAAEGAIPVFEPKWTRSKTKELGSVPGVAIPPIPPVSWSSSKPSSEVQALFTEELQEDSSGDEYIPGMAEEDKEELEESEDDPDSSFLSDNNTSIEPPTSSEPQIVEPVSTAESNWTQDGVFKVPNVPKEKDETTDEATIARRTRSKLCLSSTPLEVIEEAFVPPDITTDMYEMDCENEDWMNFLKTFTRPLDEVNKLPEEEELDPEYNVLSDEEVDKPDKEELRVDKAVKVSRKELNALISELYEFCANEQASLNMVDNDEPDASTFFHSHLSYPNSGNCTETVYLDNTFNQKDDFNAKTNCEPTEKIMITDLQICLLCQQMRQHVQLLTQNFLLTYQHPDLHQYSAQMKEYLYNFKLLGDNKEKSTFNTCNLSQAINMVKYWEELLMSNNEDVKKMKDYVDKTIYESLKYKQTGSEYIVTFPPLILETISKSEIFLYPSLLPKIPFKSPKCFTSRLVKFTDAELQLISLGLEEFVPLVVEELGENIGKHKLYNSVAEYIHKYLLPIKDPKRIASQISHADQYKLDNPIKYYFQNKKAPTCVQYFMSLEDLQILPPCKRNPDELPFQWRNYVYPQKNILQTSISYIYPFNGVQTYSILKPVNKIQKPILPKISKPSTPLCPTKRKQRLKKASRRQTLNKTNLTYLRQDPITKFKECLSKPSCINNIFELFSINSNLKHILYAINCRKELDQSDYTLNFEKSLLNWEKRQRISSSSFVDLAEKQTMLPNMPSLCTPIKINCGNDGSGNTIEDKTVEISEVGISKFQSTSSKSIPKEIVKEDQKKKADQNLKDNQDDLNALLIASSTIKPPTRKDPSVADKKKARLNKEFLANLAISTPEDREVEKQKNEMFALAYYDKMRETLEMESYHKIMQILNDYEEGDAVELYKQVEAVLRPKYNELADEFLLFLRDKEAAAVGRLIPWIRMNNTSKFLRKLEIYFKDQPSQLRKIYQCLTELSQTVGVTMEKIKSTLVPMFKGNAILTDLFLQHFLDEPPPPSMLEGPYEVFDVNKELAQSNDEEPCEIFTVPDMEDKYGGANCICNCHQIEDVEFKSKFRHCSRCGIKFVNGAVYLQTGRGLRPATISFLNSPDVDHQARLADESWSHFFRRKKRSDSNNSKPSSHSKENADEETDEDGDKKKKPKRKPQRSRKPKTTEDTTAKEAQKKAAPKKRNANKSSPRKRTYSTKKSNVNTKTEKVETEVAAGPEVEEPVETEQEEQPETELEEPTETELEEPTETEVEEPTETETEDKQYLKPGSSNGQLKRLREESCESATGEFAGDVKLGSPGHQTAESESEFCEESSQDNCESDTNSSTSSLVNRSQKYVEVLRQNWKREEDKIILEVFQTENDKDNAFRAIANQLKNRTVDEIKSRFDTLMDLLLKTVEET